MSNKRNREKVQQRKEEKKSKQVRVPTEKFERLTLEPVKGVNAKQREFLKALKTHQVIVFNAPAGCGKSFLSMSEVSDWYKRCDIESIVISRPAVGMGKSIGLLPGTLVEKMSVFIAPLIQVVTERYGVGFYENSLSKGIIEILPMEHMQGRNIEGVAIVDEVQGCTPDEIYTMITRIAEGGKLILLGDPTQTDIKGENAMQWLPKFVKDNPELAEHIAVVEATSDDIVRSGLCKLMVKAKERTKK
mgnify:CR=1 FL=1